MEIEVTKEVFVAFVAALAGQGNLEEAQGLVEGMEQDLGFKVDVFTYVPFLSFFMCDRLMVCSLGTFYNALPGQNRKDLVEGWAKESYPDVWNALSRLGQRTMKEGHRLFKMTPPNLKA